MDERLETEESNVVGAQEVSTDSGEVISSADDEFEERRMRTRFSWSTHSRWLWSAVGVVLGATAPLGSFLLHILLNDVTPWVELQRNLFFFLYELIGTSVVFGFAGFFAGRRADLLRANLVAYRGLSEIDDLTGMPNTRAFEQHYLRAVEHAERYREPLSLLFIDLDELKAINDTWGHHHGSEALVHVSRAIHAVKRETDFAARWGGDEFVVAMHGADQKSANRLASAIVERLRAHPLAIGDHHVAVTVTIGTASSEAGAARRSLFDDADKALYEGKRRGKNCVQSSVAPLT